MRVHSPKAESFPALHENTTGVGTPAIVVQGSGLIELLEPAPHLA